VLREKVYQLGWVVKGKLKGGESLGVLLDVGVWGSVEGRLRLTGELTCLGIARSGFNARGRTEEFRGLHAQIRVGGLGTFLAS